MLKVKNLTKKYSDNTVLENINLEFDRCELVFIMGESGSGKSTILNIMGLLDNDYTGEVIIHGEKVDCKDTLKAEVIRSNMLDIIFQEYNLIYYLSVEDNIRLSLGLKGELIDENRIDEVLSSLHIESLRHKKASELSGGEKQRVAIARALCRGNSIILADEPTGNLDRGNSDSFFEILREISKNHLVIVVSHDQYAAEKYADRIVTIRDRHILSDNAERNETNISSVDNKSKPMNGQTSRARFPWLWKLTIDYMIEKRRKIITSIIVMMLCMFSAGFFISTIHSMNNIKDVINSSIFDNDKITVYKCDDNMNKLILDDSFIDCIELDDNVKKVIPYYSEGIQIKSSNVSSSIGTAYTVVEGDMFDDRYEDLEGRMPKTKNEAVIGRSLANILFPDTEALGETIEIYTLADYGFECIITGIRDNDTELDRPVYLSKEMADEISCNLVKQKKLCFFVQHDGIDGEHFYAEVHPRAVSDIHMVYGRDIEQPEDAILCVSSFSTYCNMLGIVNNYSSKEVAGGKADETLINEVLGTPVTLIGSIEGTILSEVRFVGVAYTGEQQNNNEMTIILSDELIDKYSSVITNVIDIYVKECDESNLQNIYDVAERYGYEYSSEAGQRGPLINVKLSLIMMIMGAMMICMVFVTIFVIHYATKERIHDRIYEVGVEKALGAGKGFVFGLFMTYNAIVGMISGILASIVLLIVISTKIVTLDGIAILQNNLWIYFVMIFGGCVLAVFAGIIESIRISRETVVKCIAKKY